MPRSFRPFHFCQFFGVVLIPLVKWFPWMVKSIPALCFLILPLWLFSQMVPPILNFPPDIYQAENQNWDISQGTDGRMFFANNAGLLEYNGEVWRRYPSSNGSIIRSVLAQGKRVYSGCYMDFGYWEQDDHGLMQYHSLSNSLTDPLLEDEQFWNIRSVGDWILFQSLQRIYAYNISRDNFEIIASPTSRARLFTEGEEIYFVKEGELMTLENGKAERFVDLKPNGRELVGMTRMRGRRIFVAEDGSMLEVREGRLVPGNAPLGEQLPTVQVYCVLSLRDGSLALGTISQGLYILSQEGELQLHLNKESGLNNNTVLSLKEDRDGNLWIGLDNGISVLNRSSAFREYNDTDGLLGEVYAAILHRDYLYLGTNQGLFRSPYPGIGKFEFIEGTEGQVWQLREFEGVLFCGHNRGTFLIEDAQARLIPGPEGTWDFKRVPGRDSLLLQGHYQGLSLLVKRGGEWMFRNVLEGYDISSRFYEFIEPHRLIVNHEYKGIYTLEFNEGYHQVSVRKRRPPSGIGASLFRFGDRLKYATDDEIFELDEASGLFIRDSLLTSGLKSEEDKPFGILIPDGEHGRLWGFGNGSMHYVELGKIDKHPEFKKIHVPESFRVNMGVLGFECLASLGKEKYLIGRSNGFVVLDLQEMGGFVPKPEVSGISSYVVGQKPEHVSLSGTPQIAYEQRNLQIDYYVPVYSKFKEVQYQYRLQGYQDAWSTWSVEPGVGFNNLPSGKYRFEVRARVGDSISEQAAFLPFVVLPPWYFTNWALSGYILLLIAVLFGIHMLYRAHYRRQQIKLMAENRAKAKRDALSAEKKIAEARNEILQQEIESKNRELAISTMSLIRKNEFLNSLKSKLKTASDPSDIRNVLKTIDRSIGSDDDWRFFEEAFNNADKGFLQNIRERHPDLTPSDLRLCAYLRLNLSSKEIAPLLNISVRSVEVKRYRLRKKLNLSHEESLSDYILAFQGTSR